MTAEEYFDKNTPHVQLLNPSEVVYLMVQYARICCDKQKEICANEAQCGSGWEGSASWVDTDSILNSPYPEELL